MRDFVIGISTYAKGINKTFIIVPQNGHELITKNGDENGAPEINYLNAIDGVGREDLFYGYNDDNVPTPVPDRNYMISFLDIAKSNGVDILVTDYCWTKSFIDDSSNKNAAKGYISFAANHRELDNVPEYPTEPFEVNTNEITSLKDAKNFLYILNPSPFKDKENFLNAIKETNYDVFIIDLFYKDQELTPSDIQSLKMKKNGGFRLIIAYMSIGEAEDYRYYWQNDWKTNKPSWLEKENLNWPGNYKVRYWDNNWQNIIFGNDNSYLKKIIDSGFDGVYLDIIDAFKYFEEK